MHPRTALNLKGTQIHPRPWIMPLAAQIGPVTADWGIRSHAEPLT